MAYTYPPELTASIEKLMADTSFRKAWDFLEADKDATFEELKEMVVVHGASFKEHLKRSPMYKAKLEKYGAKDCTIDELGNVLGYVYGTGEPRPKILVEGHLDTVFPEETSLTVVEKDGRFYCPGIGDDTSALACDLSLLRAIQHAGLKPVGTLIFGGTVGEEGEGNARGIRHLMREHKDLDTVICVESHGAGHVCLQAVGIWRFEFTFKGPGGHSWRAFGIPTPLHAMGRAMAKIADMEVPENPRTTFTVGVVSGGTSINSIAYESTMKVDMRSVDPAALAKLGATVRALVAQAVAEENLRWKSPETITVEEKVIGAKPAGTLPEDSITALAAFAATEQIGIPAKAADAASTNHNIPNNMNVPSLVVGAGGTFQGIHSLEESYTPTDAYKAAQKALLLIFLLVGLDGVTVPLAKPCLERGPVG